MALYVEYDTGLDIILSMNGTYHTLENGYWWKIEAHKIEKSTNRPHGIRYCMTLHDNKNARVFGMDNAHIPKNRRKGYHGRTIKFDHVHNNEKDKGTAYTFTSAEQLLTDFLSRVKDYE